MKKVAKYLISAIAIGLSFSLCSSCQGGEATEEKNSFEIKTGKSDEENALQFTIPLFGSGFTTEMPDGSIDSVWDIDWGDGMKENGVNVSNDGATSLTHAYNSYNSIYTISIRPSDKNQEGWFRPFGFSSDLVNHDESSRNKMHKLISPLTKLGGFFADVTKNHYVYSSIFAKCPNLTMGQDFNLPQEIEEVGNYFLWYGFSDCSALIMNEKFNIPSSLKKVGNHFMEYSFSRCESLNMNGVFTVPQTIDLVGTYFLTGAFRYCSSLTMNEVFNLPQDITTAPDFFFGKAFSNCSSLSMNGVFTTPKNLTSVDAAFFDSAFENCTALKMGSNFEIPNGLMTADIRFMQYAFKNCIELTTTDINNTSFELIYCDGITNNDYHSAFDGCPNVDVSQLNGYAV